ncbi:MAG: beta-propeller domain-containing protein [Oscillospiraceae bacterium]|nr:beta-propeller domain-containing protein [Oscillospiraceae bacterium]
MTDKKKKAEELTSEQEAFIRLLRQKAEDTPIPMSVEPAMMMARLQEKKRVPWLKVLSPMALALTACFVLVLAGRSGNLIGTSIPVESSYSQSVSQSETESLPGSASSESSYSSSASSGEDSSAESQPDAVSSAPSVSSNSSAPGDSSVSGEENLTSPPASAENPGSEESVSSSSAAETENTQSSQIGAESSLTVPVPTPGSTYLPRNTDQDDYSRAYEAIQSAATPENAVGRYATGVLSAGISADGLQTSDEKAIICGNNGYFYVSRQSSTEILIVTSSGKVGSITAEFETPSFTGLETGSAAITNCEIVNERLFVAGTVSYTKNGAAARTVSAMTCYDLKDPAHPVLISKAAQDGTMIGMKQVDGYLYLFSRYYPDSTAPESYPEAYVPFRYFDGAVELVPSGDIEISTCSDESYIVATAFTSKDPGEYCDSLALQGGGRNYYLSEEGLYLFGERYSSGQVTTQISALTYSKGSVSLAGEVTVPGILNRSDSPNEYGSTLRILTNSYGSTNDTNLFIFDRQLNLLGSVEGLVEDQILRSVRFEKNKLYFSLYEDRSVTYALDLLIPQRLGEPYKAERSEEALQSVSAGKDCTLKLSGALGRGALTLTLKNGTEVCDSASISLEGTYSENSISLKVYENGRYVSVAYSDSGTQKQTVRLYAIEGDSLREILRYECVTWFGSFQTYLQNGKFYVVSIAETATFDAVSGQSISTVSY